MGGLVSWWLAGGLNGWLVGGWVGQLMAGLDDWLVGGLDDGLTGRMASCWVSTIELYYPESLARGAKPPWTL